MPLFWQALRFAPLGEGMPNPRGFIPRSWEFVLVHIELGKSTDLNLRIFMRDRAPFRPIKDPPRVLPLTPNSVQSLLPPDNLQSDTVRE